jgi:beta-glucanase (GH16 family)
MLDGTASQDPLRDDFGTPRLPIDVTDFHVYAADWRPGGVDFFVDGKHVHTVQQAPDYPMQMLIGSPRDQLAETPRRGAAGRPARRAGYRASRPARTSRASSAATGSWSA